MAHFARIEAGRVAQVIVVHNDILLDLENVEQEALGVQFCKDTFGADTEWVQTSYNGTMRGKYAGVGDLWDGTNFVAPAAPEPDPAPPAE